MKRNATNIIKLSYYFHNFHRLFKIVINNCIITVEIYCHLNQIMIK